MSLYVRHFARVALARGWRLDLLTTEEAVCSRAYRMLLEECGKALTTHLMPPVPPQSRSHSAASIVRWQWRVFSAFAGGYKSLLRSRVPDVVYVPTLDEIDRAVALRGTPFGGTPFIGSLMRVRFHQAGMGLAGRESRLDGLHEYLLRRLLRVPSLAALVTADESLAAYAARARVKHSAYAKIRYLPEMGSISGSWTRARARASLGIRDECSVVLLYGTVNCRKGVAELLGALADDACPSSVVALIAGRQDQATERLLAEERVRALAQGGRLWEMPGFLTDDDECRAFRAADAVWLGYVGHYGPSGVLAQARIEGLPVIASAQGVVGWSVERSEMGAVVDVADRGAVVDALRRLALDTAWRAQCGERARRVGEAHAPDRFAGAVCDLLRDAAEQRA